MKICHHPDDSTIMAYAAGALTEGFSLVLAAHLEECPFCREQMSNAQTLGGELLMDLQPMSLPAGGLEDIWDRIETTTETEPSPKPVTRAADDALPASLAPFFEAGWNSIPWRTLAPGIRHHLFDNVEAGNGSVRLLSIAPGVTIPQHTHGGGELTLVLRGAYQDETGRFQSGDLADLDSSVSHQPVAASEEPCICLIATDQPLRFSGVVSRMLQPFIGI